MRRGAGVIKCLQNEINPLDGTQARAKVPLVSVYMVRVVEDYEGVTSRLRIVIFILRRGEARPICDCFLPDTVQSVLATLSSLQRRRGSLLAEIANGSDLRRLSGINNSLVLFIMNLFKALT